jgi:enoyl-CoA hydratase
MAELGTTESRQGDGFVQRDVRGDVAVLTLDHPQDRNALSLAMTRALTEAVTAVRADEAAGALVLTSSGPVFSSGGSVDDLLDPKAPLEEMYAGFVAVAECGLPTVAAVNGPALGAGMNLALACDLIVCSPAARFETRFLGLGLHPGGGHLWQLQQRMGRQGAAALALFGESLSGADAVAKGLAWTCVDDVALLDTAVELASRAAKLDRPVMARTRATLDDCASVHGRADALARELPAQQWSMGRPEFATRLDLLRQRLGRTAPDD